MELKDIFWEEKNKPKNQNNLVGYKFVSLERTCLVLEL